MQAGLSFCWSHTPICWKSHATAQLFYQTINLVNSISLVTSAYGKSPKILNTFLVLLSTKMLVFRAVIHKMLVRIVNREDPDQTASSEAVRSGSALFV